MDRSLRTIAVDLTPVLPGGENGGAKIFVLELLKCLAGVAPKIHFILLTNAASHDELAALDQPNMRRQMVVDNSKPDSSFPREKLHPRRILLSLAGRIRLITRNLSAKLNIATKHPVSGGLLSDMQVDLLFCPFTAPTYFEPGIPMVSTIYDLQQKSYPDFFTAEETAHRNSFFHDACRRANALAVISNYSRDEAIVHGNIDPERIRTIYMRIAQRISMPAGQDEQFLKQFGLFRQRFLLYPANFWKHKNHEMLLTAFGMACGENLAADIKLVCTGAPGERQAYLQRKAEALNIGDRVVFPGFLSNSGLAVFMDNCAGVVFPSLFEGFGLPVLEAMAARVPVACSNSTSLPEAAADAAIFFDPHIPAQIKEAMISLTEDETLRTRLINAGIRRVPEFSDTKRMAREYLELFHFALTKEHHETIMTGVYADGWAGPVIKIQIAAATSTRSLEIEFSRPKWMPHRRFTFQVRKNGVTQGVPVIFNLGTNHRLAIPVSSGRDVYEVAISPTFLPALFNQSNDLRELSLIVEECTIMMNNGDCLKLFPENTER